MFAINYLIVESFSYVRSKCMPFKLSLITVFEWHTQSCSRNRNVLASWKLALMVQPWKRIKGSQNSNRSCVFFFSACGFDIRWPHRRCNIERRYRNVAVLSELLRVDTQRYVQNDSSRTTNAKSIGWRIDSFVSRYMYKEANVVLTNRTGRMIL